MHRLISVRRAAAEDQGVLHRVNLLQNGGSFGPTRLRSCGAVTGAIPDIPFIERKHDPLRRPPAGGHPIRDSDDLIDVTSDQIGFGHEVARSVAVFGKITVEGNVLHHVECLFQNDSFPFGECWHAAAGGAACDQFYVGVEPTHQLGGFTGKRAVFPGGLGADLPRSIHFIAQAPKPDVMRSRMPVFDVASR